MIMLLLNGYFLSQKLQIERQKLIKKIIRKIKNRKLNNLCVVCFRCLNLCVVATFDILKVECK